MWFITESEDKEDCKASSEDEEQIKSPSNDAEKKRKGKGKRQVMSDDSTDDEIDESEKKGNKSNCGDSPEELVKKKENTTKNEETRGINTSGGKKMPENDKDSESDAENVSEKSDKLNGSESSDGGKGIRLYLDVK